MTHDNIWAPWRINYIKGLDEPSEPDRAGDKPGCFLCDAADPALGEAARDQRYVIVSDQRGTLMLNRYPYTNGHLLAAPRDHLADLADMTPTQRAELMELVALGNDLLRETMNPQGVNIGMNLGRCAGAGLPGHAHMHLVPRWNGDVNFMAVVANARVIPQSLEQAHHWLKQAAQTRR